MPTLEVSIDSDSALSTIETLHRLHFAHIPLRFRSSTLQQNLNPMSQAQLTEEHTAHAQLEGIDISVGSPNVNFPSIDRHQIVHLLTQIPGVYNKIVSLVSKILHLIQYILLLFNLGLSSYSILPSCDSFSPLFYVSSSPSLNVSYT